MSVVSYLFSPKRFAALQIAQDIIRSDDSAERIRKKLGALRSRDGKLYEYVVEELGKYGYSLSVDS